MIDTLQTGLIAAFAAGTISFLSPCVLPLVPGYVSYIAGQSIGGVSVPRTRSQRFRTIALSLCFVLGFSTIFVILGASATALGRLLLAHRYELNIAGGVIVIGFGLFALGVLRPWWLMREWRMQAVPSRRRPIAAYLLGIAFALGWSPCIGPILAAILTVGAAAATIDKGVALLATYSLGLGVPFLLAAVFTDGLLVRVKSMGGVGRACQMFAGGVMIVMGAAMITGQLSTLSYWLLDTFPVLSAIG
jgi:cytochrome c-type biogenesis protein